MFKYIAKRVFYTVITLIVLLTLLFFLMQLIPGYPIEKGLHETEAAFQDRLFKLGLLDNPLQQYFSFWGKLFTKGEFGIIFINQGNVINRFMEPVGYTLLIALPAFFISAILGIFFGTIAAYYRGRWQDNLINLFSVFFISIPSFVLALYLIQFAGLINIPTNIVIPGSDGFTIEKMILSLIIPIVSMVLTSVSTTVYFTRNELVEVFKQEYIKTALSKGLSFRVVVFRHAFRNAAIPVLYSLLPSLLLILSGSIIIERFFNVPGTASLVIEAVQTNEYYIVMFSAVFYSGIYFLVQIIFDVLSTIIDPKIKLAEKSNISYFEQIKSYVLRKKDLGLNLSKNIINSPVKENKEILNKAVQFNVIHSKPDVLNNNISKYDKEMFKRIDSASMNNDEILGKPNNQIKDIFKRFVTNKVAVFFSILFVIIILLSIFYPIIGPSINAPINPDLADISSFLPPRFPLFGLNGIITEIMTQEKLNSWQLVPGAVQKVTEINNGLYEVVLNPYAHPDLAHFYPLFGTGPQGRDWTNVLWISTSSSLFMALIVASISTILGAIYGAIAGFNAGKPVDTFMMRIVELISGVPTIVWILVITLVFSGGDLSLFTIAGALIFTSWIWSAWTTRVFIMKYKDSEFIEASKTLGANRRRLIFIHLLPNISGKLMVRFVNQIPRVIFFETALVFLGLKAPTDASLGSMIETARQTGYFNLLLAPTLIIVLITLCAQIIANAFNDSLDPRIIGK